MWWGYSIFWGSISPRDLCQDLRGGGPLTINAMMELFLISRKNKCTSMREMSNKTTLTECLYTQNSLWIGASNPKSRGAMQTSATKCSSPPWQSWQSWKYWQYRQSWQSWIIDNMAILTILTILTILAIMTILTILAIMKMIMIFDVFFLTIFGWFSWLSKVFSSFFMVFGKFSLP